MTTQEFNHLNNKDMIISDTKNIANKVKELKRDCRPSYGLRFTIVGEETFNEFAKHFGNVKEPYVHYSMPKAVAMAEKSKATEAKMVTAYRMEMYKGTDGECSADGTKFMAIAYKGEYYQIIPNGNASSSRFSIFPLEDNREYYQKGVDRNEGHPNLIGALTDKKMSEWAEHIRKYQAEYDAKVEKNAAETNAVISAFKSEAAAADCVSEFGKNCGTIERNGVRIKYQVREDGRVSVEMCLTKFPRTTEEKLAYFAALTR